MEMLFSVLILETKDIVVQRETHQLYAQKTPPKKYIVPQVSYKDRILWNTPIVQEELQCAKLQDLY